VGAKIRRAQEEKIPYMVVIGPKELEAGTISVRNRAGDQAGMTLDAFMAKLKQENVPG
jgi:threonyl-tRNA synthetase